MSVTLASRTLKLAAKHGNCSVVDRTDEQKALHQLPACELAKAEWLKCIFDEHVSATFSKNQSECANHFLTFRASTILTVYGRAADEEPVSILSSR